MLYRRISIIMAGILAVCALTASANPTPTPSPTPSLNSGAEGAKAALVRIELMALSEIAHIDASSGVAEIRRGTSEVPLGSGTGVLVSADGIVATTWENLTLDDGTVAVFSANELFSNVIRVPIVGNDGNPLRRGTTPDEYWARHLQHCYDLVDHCVLFRVPQYRIRTFTSEPGSVVAELLYKPPTPEGVALLRITGGGGAPTATLAPSNAVPGAESSLLGFVGQPTPADGPAEVPVTVDAAAGRIAAPEHDLGALLDSGVSGGTVIDDATGQVLGLAGPRQADGKAILTPAAAIRAAMAAAGVESSQSKFDVVFRRGVDYLASGNQGGSAVSAFEESLTYYDSALAARHLEQAREMGNQEATEQPPASASAADPVPLPTALLATLAGVLLLGGILAAVALRQRKGAIASSSSSSEPNGRPRHASGADITAPASPGKPQLSDSARTDAAKSTGTNRQDEHPPREGPELPAQDSTRAAGPFALRAAQPSTEAGGQSQPLCSKCGQQVQPGARFCVSCGQPVG